MFQFKQNDTQNGKLKVVGIVDYSGSRMDKTLQNKTALVRNDGWRETLRTSYAGENTS